MGHGTIVNLSVRMTPLWRSFTSVHRLRPLARSQLILQAHHPGPGSWLDKVTAQKELENQAGPSSHSNPA
jgi:hypothetical protein